MRYLYKGTKQYYGLCGQKSLDPVVFFKLCLIGYLENIISDRKLIEHSSMRLDILYFLNYDIDEELPWHSTISRTRHISNVDKERYRKAKENKASLDQQTLQASKGELKEIKSRNKKWSDDQNYRTGAKNQGSKYTSNKTHYSPTDPDARISVKPGKARKLNYLGQMGVDTAHHVISHIGADFADKKDNQCLPLIIKKLKPRLNEHGLFWQNILADTAYSSGENYAMLEKENLISYIPPHGTYKGGPEGFSYNEEGDYYLCKNNKKLLFKGTKRNVKGILDNHYATVRKDCIDCPFKQECKGKSFEKRIRITAFKKEYERAILRVKSKRGRYMKTKRHSTVEPVFGTLTQFMGLRKVNTLGIRQANKVMLMAAVAYNIKKYLKFTQKMTNSMSQEAQLAALYFIDAIGLIIRPYKPLKNTQI